MAPRRRWPRKISPDMRPVIAGGAAHTVARGSNRAAPSSAPESRKARSPSFTAHRLPPSGLCFGSERLFAKSLFASENIGAQCRRQWGLLAGGVDDEDEDRLRFSRKPLFPDGIFHLEAGASEPYGASGDKDLLGIGERLVVT